MNRLFAILLVLALGFVAACSSGSSTGENASSATAEGNVESTTPASSAEEAAEEPAKEPAKEPITLTFGLWNQDQAPVYEEVFAKFKESHPDIDVKVEVTPFDQYWTKLETAAIGEVLPDVFWMNGPNFIKYASNDILMPLNEKVERDGFALTDFPKSLVDLYTYDGSAYAIPKDFDTIVLYYNKEMFDQKGVPYPDESWDWNKLTEVAKQFTDPAAGTWGIAAQMSNQLAFYNLIFQSGGYVISEDKKKSGYDDPETIQGLQFWTDLIHVQKVSPTLAQMTDTAPRSLFQSGKIAMFFDGSWWAKPYFNDEALKGKIDLTLLPKGDERATVVHGLGHSIAAGTKYPEEAWELVKFLGSKEANEIFAASGLFIPALNGMQDAWVQSIPEMNLQAAIDMVEYGYPYPTSVNTAQWQEFEPKILGPAWAGEISIEEAAAQLAQEMNNVLSKE